MRFPHEPEGPILNTTFPGPKTQESIATYGETSCNLTQQFPINLQESVGNYVADTDGNKYLDVITSNGCVGSGYNHPVLREASKTDLMKLFLATRTGIGINPPIEIGDLYERAFMDIAPKGMTRVNGAMCGACSVEASFKYALISYAQKKRGGMDVSPT